MCVLLVLFGCLLFVFVVVVWFCLFCVWSFHVCVALLVLFGCLFFFSLLLNCVVAVLCFGLCVLCLANLCVWQIYVFVVLFVWYVFVKFVVVGLLCCVVVLYYRVVFCVVVRVLVSASLVLFGCLCCFHVGCCFVVLFVLLFVCVRCVCCFVGVVWLFGLSEFRCRVVVVVCFRLFVFVLLVFFGCLFFVSLFAVVCVRCKVCFCVWYMYVMLSCWRCLVVCLFVFDVVVVDVFVRALLCLW